MKIESYILQAFLGVAANWAQRDLLACLIKLWYTRDQFTLWPWSLLLTCTERFTQSMMNERPIQRGSDLHWRCWSTLNDSPLSCWRTKREICLTSLYLPRWDLQLWDHTECNGSSKTRSFPTGCSLCKQYRAFKTQSGDTTATTSFW